MSRRTQAKCIQLERIKILPPPVSDIYEEPSRKRYGRLSRKYKSKNEIFVGKRQISLWHFVEWRAIYIINSLF